MKDDKTIKDWTKKHSDAFYELQNDANKEVAKYHLVHKTRLDFLEYYDGHIIVYLDLISTMLLISEEAIELITDNIDMIMRDNHHESNYDQVKRVYC